MWRIFTYFMHDFEPDDVIRVLQIYLINKGNKGKGISSEFFLFTIVSEWIEVSKVFSQFIVWLAVSQ